MQMKAVKEGKDFPILMMHLWHWSVELDILRKQTDVFLYTAAWVFIYNNLRYVPNHTQAYL